MKQLLDIAKECGANIFKDIGNKSEHSSIAFKDEATLLATINAFNAQGKEPVYQLCNIAGTEYSEISKETYDKWDLTPKRILYTSPLLDEMSEWISVEDRLPEHNVTVLCKGESYDTNYTDGYFVARYRTDFKTWAIGKQEEEPEVVTHWKPIKP